MPLALKALCDYDLSHGHKLNYSKYSDNDLVAVICDDLPRLKTIVSKSGDLANGPYLSFWFQKKDILDWLNDIGQFDPNKKPSCGILKKSRDGTYFDWADQNTDPTMKEYLSKFTKKELIARFVGGRAAHIGVQWRIVGFGSTVKVGGRIDIIPGIFERDR